MAANLLACGHPSACEGLAGPNGDQPGCGWCADIADNGLLIDHLSRTYDHFSGGRISKPLTRPEEVFTIAGDLATEDAEEQRRETIEECAAKVEAIGCSCTVRSIPHGVLVSRRGFNVELDGRLEGDDRILRHDPRCPIAQAAKLREMV
jgi:hypothetical protein